MPADDPSTGRATITDVYRVVGELRQEVNRAFAEAREDQRIGMDALLRRLDEAVLCIRDEFVPLAVFEAAQRAQDAALISAIDASRGDREKLWEAKRAHDNDLDALKVMAWKAAGAAGIAAVVIAPIVTVLVSRIL